MNHRRNFKTAAAIAAIMCASLVTAPAQTQTNLAPAAPPAAKADHSKKEPAKAEKKAKSMPFQGTLAKVDKTEKSITVGQRTFIINSETKIFKDSKPAQLSEGIAGEHVTGSYRKTDDGKLIANSIYFGGKTEGKNPAKPAPKTAEKQPDAKPVQ
jgi:hypothetical protein